MHVNSNHNTQILIWKPLWEKTKKLVFINVCGHQPIVKNLVGTNLLETPIYSVEHNLAIYCVDTNLLETPISSTKHQLNKMLCRHQPTRDTNLLT
jgi:hypothetical protein